MSGCSSTRTQAIVSDYDTAKRLLKQGELQKALVLADGELQRCGYSATLCWKSRLLKAEILVQSGSNEEALALLGTSATPPTQDLQAQRLMHQGLALFRLSDFSRADEAFKEALTCHEPSAS